MIKGKLYLIPAILGDDDDSIQWAIPEKVKESVNHITHYIVENERTARRYLLKIGYKTPVDNTRFCVLNQHTREEEISAFLSPADAGHHIGLISEAGVPCVADPGNVIVRLAHDKNIQVVPLTGPSSIILSLMASGLNGQNFAFNGYLPIEKGERARKIKHLENLSARENQTQIFIETPYRNQKLLSDIIASCRPDTLLCIASNITMPDEFIKTRTMKEWKSNLPDLGKRPAVFLLHTA